MTYKVVSWTPKGELAEAIYQACKYENMTWLKTNPQDLVREKLYEAGYLLKQQPKGCGDKSWWEVGQPIKVSLWQENEVHFAKAAKEAGMTKQQIMTLVFEVYMGSLSQK